jgi:hypothetical protein
MSARKNGACVSEQPEPEAEPSADKDLDLGSNLEPDLDDGTDFDAEEDLDIDPDLEGSDDSNFELTASAEPGESTANVGETSVEIDVEELIAELEADRKASDPSEEHSSRKRLEDILEERRISDELDEIDEFDSIDSE